MGIPDVFNNWTRASGQTGFQCFPAELSPADNKLSKGVSQSPADQESWLSDQDNSQRATWSYPL